VASGAVFFEHGDLVHIACWSRTLTLKPIEETDRSRAIRARAAESFRQAPRLVEESQRRRVLSE
jgi:hypothetical protein